MAKLYDRVHHEVLWSDSDICAAVEDAYFELSDMLAAKKLDGHNRRDQWYMAMHSKLSELIEVMSKCPIDELDSGIEELL